MACFIVPAVEAVAVTVAAEVVKRQEKTHAEEHIAAVSWSRKLSWLRNLLWGGVVLLAYEHLWHGEIVPFFPFLTAMGSAEDTAEMVHEMSTVGVTMAVIVTLVWAVLCLGADTVLRRREVSLQ